MTTHEVKVRIPLRHGKLVLTIDTDVTDFMEMVRGCAQFINDATVSMPVRGCKQADAIMDAANTYCAL